MCRQKPAQMPVNNPQYITAVMANELPKWMWKSLKPCDQATALLFPATFLTTYGIAVSLGHADSVWPYISDTGINNNMLIHTKQQATQILHIINTFQIWYFPNLISSKSSQRIRICRSDDVFSWRFILNTGTVPPESCVFGQFLNIGAFLLIIVFYIKYKQVKEDCFCSGRDGKCSWRLKIW